MKEQKELIEAIKDALWWVKEALENYDFQGNSDYKRTLKCRDVLAKFISESEEQPERRKAPWTDSEGNELFEGDEIFSEKIGTCEIIFWGTPVTPEAQWRIILPKGKGIDFLDVLLTGHNAVKVTK